MKLSNQAIGALMMALQKSLMEQSDIVPVLKGFEFVLTTDGLVVKNPPVVKAASLVDEFDEYDLEAEQVPRYTYKCQNCDIVFEIVHSIKEKLTDCEECTHTEALVRVPSSSIFISKLKNNTNTGRKVGDLVKQHIEEAKEEVKNEKKSLRTKELDV